MRYLQRPMLSAGALALFRRRTAKIRVARDPKRISAKLWKSANAAGDREARVKLKKMAPPIERCMYCECSEGTGIDHFWPKHAYPLRTFDWLNFVWCCAGCNSTGKRNAFPLDQSGQPLLIDPTSEDPTRHLGFSFTTGRFIGRTPKGRRSIETYALNRPSLATGRRDAVHATKALILLYDDLRASGLTRQAEQVRKIVARMAFPSVVAEVLRCGRLPHGSLLLDDKVIAALKRCPELC